MSRSLVVFLFAVMIAGVVAAQSTQPASRPASQPKPTTPQVVVPYLDTTVTVDADLTKDEWSGAVEQRLPTGAKLLLRHDANGVAIGVRSMKQGVLTIFLELDGKVYALHSSALIGTAIYEKQGGDGKGVWKLTQPFEYGVSSPGFEEQHGWTGSTTEPRGKGDIECLLSRKLLRLDTTASGTKTKPTSQQQQLKIRIVHAAIGSGTLPGWPALATDDTANERLLMGHDPAELRFDPAQWGTLELAPKK
ncbi:MAG: hypothetical protein AAF581_18650 [Planctomycetota bacterium]